MEMIAATKMRKSVAQVTQSRLYAMTGKALACKATTQRTFVRNGSLALALGL